MGRFLMLVCLGLSAWCADTPEPPESRYLALGDSYTIGAGVAAPSRWPEQLASLVMAHGVPQVRTEIIARTGWTTAELLHAIAVRQPHGPYALVTLQIGVNDQFRGHDPEQYRRDLVTALATATHLAGDQAQKVLVLSIPDWGVTPFAAGRDRVGIARDIDRYNAICQEESQRAGTRWVDVTGISRADAGMPGMTVADGLHPSASQYAQWVAASLASAQHALTDVPGTRH